MTLVLKLLCQWFAEFHKANLKELRDACHLLFFEDVYRLNKPKIPGSETQNFRLQSFLTAPSHCCHTNEGKKLERGHIGITNLHETFKVCSNRSTTTSLNETPNPAEL
jgi:hypothetical protein